MCVIIVAETGKPSETMLRQAWRDNDHGAGVAWNEVAKGKDKKPLTVKVKDAKGKEIDKEIIEVVYKKGLELDDVLEIVPKLPLPFVVHFRKASQGGVWPELTHPFVVSDLSPNKLSGRTRHPVLFHNGTWGAWQEKAMEAAVRSGVNVPLGLWSDSRAMAWMSSEQVCGYGFMGFLGGQKGVIFGPDWYNVFRGEGWEQVQDGENLFWCSNDRPWKNNQTGYGNHHNHVPAARRKECLKGDCVRTDVGSDGYCGAHPNGREAGQTTRALLASHGGGADQSPFQNRTPNRLITPEEVEKLGRDNQISPLLVKQFERLFERATDPRLSEEARKSALESLEVATRSLCVSGRLDLTQAPPTTTTEPISNKA